MWETRDNSNFILNIACPYTSTHERETTLGRIREEFKESEISRKLIKESLFTDKVDILLRTSGECRLSDFLTLQCSLDTVIYFVDCYWPEFTFWVMAPLLFRYQVNSISKKVFHYSLQTQKISLTEKESIFVEKLRKERIDYCQS
jgi:ditrans,polycis-polyprenyl diphosphate synthase